MTHLQLKLKVIELIFRRNEPTLATRENGLIETKLVDIEVQEFEEREIPQIEKGKEACLLQLTEDCTKGISKCLVSCYDMGGHTEYYNSQQVSN